VKNDAEILRFRVQKEGGGVRVSPVGADGEFNPTSNDNALAVAAWGIGVFLDVGLTPDEIKAVAQAMQLDQLGTDNATA
tara:strand:- start:618 stop:854 length:237 start_codon:yes stop_codon:yes gene_type:complete